MSGGSICISLAIKVSESVTIFNQKFVTFTLFHTRLQNVLIFLEGK